MALVRHAHEGDVEDLDGRLRAADLKELAAHGVPGRGALFCGLADSSPCYAIEHEGRCIALFGATAHPGDPGIGHVWLLGSDEVQEISFQFLRESKRWLAEISKPYSLVCNVVHEENRLHIRWLKFLGFRFLRREKPFIEFARIV
jgi:hypothetical protein